MRHINLFLIAMLLVSAIELGQSPAPAVAASTITVATLQDDTDTGDGCSLREAITNANADAATFSDCLAGSGSDTIIFASSLAGNIQLASPLPDISDTDGLTINGSAGKISVFGNGTFRPFAILNGVTVIVQNLTISSGFGTNGGNIYNAGTLNLQNSTLLNGFGTNGGAIYNDNGALTITNSTISGNTATNGGAIYSNNGTVSITNTTIYDNTATTGIIYNLGMVTIKNSIIADGNGSNLCAGNVPEAASSTNLSDEASCGLSVTTVTLGQLALGPLADNGGSTRTFGLLNGSAAINTANAVYCPAIDQRGVARPQGAGCDIGSYELKTSLTVSPNPVAFGNQPIWFVSTPKTVTITNAGESNVNIGSITVAPAVFNIVNDLCSGTSIAAAGTCTFDVTFSPVDELAKTGTITIPSNIAGSPTLISVTGKGYTPTNMLLSPNFDTLTQPIPWKNPIAPYTLYSVRDCTVSLSPMCSIHFKGNSRGRKQIVYQTVKSAGKAGHRYYIQLSSMASGVPIAALYKGELVFYTANNRVSESFPLTFTKGTHGWETLNATITATQDYYYFVFYMFYQERLGEVWYDNAVIVSLP